IATLAREDLVFMSEVRATFALIRGTAAIVFVLPFVATLLLRVLAPRTVMDAYSSPLGWGVAALVSSACVGAYHLVIHSERRAARQAEAAWLPRPHKGRGRVR